MTDVDLIRLSVQAGAWINFHGEICAFLQFEMDKEAANIVQLNYAEKITTTSGSTEIKESKIN